MCKDLVRLTTQDLNNSMPIVSSREVCEHFNKKHKNVIQSIRKLMAENIAVKKMFYETTYISERGRSEIEFLMNRDGFSLLVMGFTGKEALGWKLKYIKAFNLMENELKARQETRHIGITIRKSLTDTIKNKVSEEGNFKNFAYSNYSKLVYKKVLGKTVKKAKEELNLKEKDNIRNYLTMDQLQEVQDLESKIAFYIEMRTDLTQNDKEVYQEVKKYIDSLD